MRDLLIAELGEAPEEARIEDAARRAAKLREQHLSAAEHAEQQAARQLAQEIRRERAFLEDKARGGTMELLRGLSSHKTPLLGLAGDTKAFEALFARASSGPVIDGTSWNGGSIADGSTLSFPPGVHKLLFPQGMRFPRDLVVQGAGIDTTLVRLHHHPLRATGEVMSLCFRDLTIDCNSHYLADLRFEPASISLDTCRVVGFDGFMIQARALAFRARNSRFEAGFRPGASHLFGFRQGIARLDNCVVQGPFVTIYDRFAGTFLFHRCDLVDAPTEAEREFANPPDGVRFEDCRFTYLAPGVAPYTKWRPLSDLNPDWPKR